MEEHQKADMLPVVLPHGGGSVGIFFFLVLSVLFHSSQIFYNERFNTLVIFSLISHSLSSCHGSGVNKPN